MNIPTLLLALLIALLYGALYHLLRNGGVWRLFFYLVLSVAGFAFGHLIGLWRGWNFLMLGSVYLGMGSIGSLVFLVVGDWLSRIEADKESKV
jgi:hypothetical protein